VRLEYNRPLKRSPTYRTGSSVRDYVAPRRPLNKENEMLEAIAVILLVLWLLGLVSSYTLGGFIHLLLVLAIVVILLRVIQGRRAI
jgi:hypothetical protein